MKQINESVGIDISKGKFDAYLCSKQLSNNFSNNKCGFNELLKWVKSQVNDIQCVIFCFEHTGMYSMPLAAYLSGEKMRFALIPALEIKRSMGMVRGKNDVVDAKRIAEYAFLRREKLKCTQLPPALLQELKLLLSQRERLVGNRAGYKTTLKELKSVFKLNQHPELFELQEKMIKLYTKEIDALDEAILKLIKSDVELNNLYNLIVSVKGIGTIVAANLLVVTNNFTSFDNSRKLACYCGLAPFEKQSGISLRGKSRVSHYANKRLKALLNLSACSAVKSDPELKLYYERRLAQGKSKLSTLNVVRNKLLHRIFAVVKRQTPYVEMQKWAA